MKVDCIDFAPTGTTAATRGVQLKKIIHAGDPGIKATTNDGADPAVGYEASWFNLIDPTNPDDDWCRLVFDSANGQLKAYRKGVGSPIVVAQLPTAP